MKKCDSCGNLERHKVILVIKGFTQKDDIDYKEKFSIVSLKDSPKKIIVALVAHYDIELHQNGCENCLSMRFIERKRTLGV